MCITLELYVHITYTPVDTPLYFFLDVTISIKADRSGELSWLQIERVLFAWKFSSKIYIHELRAYKLYIHRAREYALTHVDTLKSLSSSRTFQFPRVI